LAAIQPEKGIIKRNIPLVIFTILLFLSGCRKINRPQATFAAGPTAETAGSSAIEPDQDVRFGDLSRLAMTLDRALLLTLTFHESNVWPDHYGAIAWEILGPGKNPG
jgi:hypothetical protein